MQTPIVWNLGPRSAIGSLIACGATPTTGHRSLPSRVHAGLGFEVGDTPLPRAQHEYAKHDESNSRKHSGTAENPPQRIRRHSPRHTGSQQQTSPEQIDSPRHAPPFGGHPLRDETARRVSPGLTLACHTVTFAASLRPV